MKKRMIVLGICVLLLTILFTGCMNGDSSDGFEPPEPIPTVSMTQSGSYIYITGVDGPVTNGTGGATISIANQTTGLPTGSYAIYDGPGGNSSKIECGDIIAITLTGEASGTMFTVQMLYGDDVVGTYTYRVP